MQFLSRLRQFIHLHSLLKPEAPCVLCVSGGIDSMVLLDSFSKILTKNQVASSVVISVDHGVRSESKLETAWVQKESEKRGFKSELVTLDIHNSSGSFQNDARVQRREAVMALAEKYGIEQMCTAHHKDDQVETILIRLLRGTGVWGLSGIKPESDGWIHPFLCFTKDEIRTYAEENSVEWCDDPSNDKVNYTRNKVRLELLPYLEKEFNPQIRDKLLGLAEEVESLSSVTKHKIDKLAVFPALVVKEKLLLLDLEVWREHSYIVQSGALRKLLWKYFQRTLERKNLQQIIDSIAGNQGEQAILKKGTLEVFRIYNRLVLGFGEDLQGVFFRGIQIPVTRIGLEGEFDLKSCRLEVTKGSYESFSHEEPWTFFLPEREGCSGFDFRTRNENDFFLSGGMTKSIKKWMINQKIPASFRRLYPLLARGHQVVWIPGFKESQKFSCFPDEMGWFLRISDKEWFSWLQYFRKST